MYYIELLNNLCESQDSKLLFFRVVFYMYLDLPRALYAIETQCKMCPLIVSYKYKSVKKCNLLT